MNNLGALQSAAFMMEGLHDAGYDACITSWNEGCIELVTEIVQYAPEADKMYKTGVAKNDGSSPGVFDYEVSSPFGHWFGCFIIERGKAPARGVALKELNRMSEAFFN